MMKGRNNGKKVPRAFLFREYPSSNLMLPTAYGRPHCSARLRHHQLAHR
jgi:hypothetical protein